MVERLSMPVIFLSLQLLLAGCAGVRLYEPIASTPRAVSETAPAPVEAAPPAELTENPYQSRRGRASSEALRRFELANSAMQRQEWRLAMIELEWLLEHYPDLSGPCLNMALAFRQQGKTEAAEEYFRKTLQINRNNLDAYNQYAIFLRAQGRFQEAEQAYLQALEVWDQHADSHRNIGVLYDMYMGDRSRALLHFQRYQELTGADDRMVAGWIVDLKRRQVLLVKGS